MKTIIVVLFVVCLASMIVAQSEGVDEDSASELFDSKVFSRPRRSCRENGYGCTYGTQCCSGYCRWRVRYGNVCSWPDF
ncbi:hypothetical protein ACQ4LE_003431 [Meloidogyne hapla]